MMSYRPISKIGCVTVKSLFNYKHFASVQHICKRDFLYSSETGVSRDSIAYIAQPIDLRISSIKGWFSRKLWEQHKTEHSYIEERHKKLGPDLATAHFVVARDGAAKFVGEANWRKKNKEGSYILPREKVNDLYIEAIDASDTKMIYCSFDNFIDLEHFKFLNLSRCPYIDDWCLDRISGQLESLQVLDLSGCPLITDRGLSVLIRLRKLKRLVLNDMPSVQNLELITLLLEEYLPECVVDGVNYTQPANANSQREISTPLQSSIGYLNDFIKKKMHGNG